MYAVILGLHILVCLSLVALVLVQSGKGGGLAGGAFGGSAQTVFGGRGATDVITRATVALGVVFFVTSLVLALMTAGGGSSAPSLLQQEAQQQQQAPAPGALPQVPPTQAPSGDAPGAPAAPGGNDGAPDPGAGTP